MAMPALELPRLKRDCVPAAFLTVNRSNQKLSSPLWRKWSKPCHGLADHRQTGWTTRQIHQRGYPRQWFLIHWMTSSFRKIRFRRILWDGKPSLISLYRVWWLTPRNSWASLKEKNIRSILESWRCSSIYTHQSIRYHLHWHRWSLLVVNRRWFI